MANPIKYTDLFDSGLQGQIEALKDTVKTLSDMLEGLKGKASGLTQALAAANPGTPGGQQEISRLTKEIAALVAQNERLVESKTRVAAAEKQLTDAAKENIISRELTRQATRNYTNEVKAAIGTMKLDEEQRKRLSNAAELQKMSYNELSQAYTQLVALANSMHASNEQEIKDRQQIIQTAAMVREEQKRLKEAMGNYTLSVGNYEKAFNGLDIAMQQIVRETPTITMGARMYFMAISNNVPILTDQIKRIREENAARQVKIDTMKAEGAATAEIQALQKQQISVGWALMKSLLSWQTLMVLGITLLTKYGDKIVDWIANVFSAEGATKAWKEAQEDLNKTFDEAEVSAAKAEAQADVLYRIATDETRAVEDRIKAGQILQNQYEDYFGNLSTEEIMLGKATAAHDALTKSLMNQAVARAYLDKITELYGKRIDAEGRAQKANAEYMQYSVADEIQAPFSIAGQSYGGSGVIVGDAIKRAREEGNAAREELAAIDDEIQKLIDSMPVDGLFDMLFNGGGRKGKGPKVVDPIDAVISNLKYIRQAREAEINNIEDDTERELALTEFKYDNEIADLRAFAAQQQAIAYTVAEMEQELEKETNLEKRNAMQERINDLKREWNITEEGVQAVNDTIIQKETEKQNKLRDIREKHINQMKTDYQNILKMELDIANKRAENDLEGEALDEAKIQNQIHYWEQILVLLQGFNDGSIEAARNIELVEETIRGLYLTLDKKADKESWFEKFFGKDSPLVRRLLKDLEKALKETANNIKDIISLYEEMAHAAVEAAEAQVSAAERVYDAELTAYENGYANNVEYARKELELRRNTLEEAEARERRYAEMKEQVDAAMNMASMIRTSYNLAESASNLMASGSKWGIVGVGIAAAAIAAMFATFAAARIQARKLSSMQYGEGGTEYIGYGGTHASGNDVDFGTMPDGRPRRIERGETVAVINAKQTSKYGYSTVSDIIDSINKGEFVERYMTAFSGADGEFTMNMSSSFDSPYLSDISRDLKAIRKGGEYSESVMADGSRIVRYKNYTRRIRP